MKEKLKMIHLDTLTEILNPLFADKCDSDLAWELIELLDEIEPQITKLNKLREKVIKTYAKKDEAGNIIQKNVGENKVQYEFGENLEKVAEELNPILNMEIDIRNKLSIKHFKTNIKIKPIDLKFLKDLDLLKEE